MSTRRRIIVSLLALVGVPAVVLVLAIVAIAVFGVSIDVSRWREAIAARASTALERPVALDGRLELELGRETGLHVAGVRILNPPGFDTPELATLREARARIDLLAALRGRLQVRSLEAEDGRVRLERAADGRVNWTSAVSAPSTRSSSASPLVAIEIERTSIRSFHFELHDQRSGAHHFFDLDELDGTGKWSEPLKLTLRGSVAGSFPYAVTIAGGSARLLQEGREAWPFTLDLQFLSTRLHADGTVDINTGSARFGFRAGAEDLEQVGRFLQTTLPSLGPAALSGSVMASLSAVELKDLQGTLGPSGVAGGLVLTLGGARRRVSGELAITSLDVRPFLDAAPQPPERRLTYDELMRRRLPVHNLVPVDADLVLRVDRWLGLPVDVRDAQITLHADERGLRAPISGTIAGVPLTGSIDLETAASTPTLALEATARNVPLRGLRQSFPSASNLDGTLGTVALRVGARGQTLGALVDDLELRLTAQAVRLRYATAAGRRPADLALDTLEVVIPRGQPLRGTAQGRLLGTRANLAFRASELPRMLREPTTPIQLQLAVGGITARVEGTLAWPGAGGGSDLAFQLEAQRSGDLARWVGFAPESRLPLVARGRARTDRGGWRLEDTTVKVGRSELTLDAHRAGTSTDPVLVVAVRSTLIDVPELSTLHGKPTRAPARSRQALLDAPLLLQGIDLPAADIGLGLHRIVLGRAELNDVGLSTRIRDGHLLPSPFSARFAGVTFEGIAGLDLRGAVPTGSLSMSTGRVDVGALLRKLGVADDIDAHADILQVKLAGSASSLGDLLERGTLEVRVLGGKVTVRGPADRAVAEVELEQAQVTARPGQPVTLDLRGAVSDVPTQITVSTGTLADLARDASVVPFSVKAYAAGARLTLTGRVMLPLGHGGDLVLDLAGEQLDSLNVLAGAALPAWKDWSLQGPVSMTASGYEVTQLALKVGESRLNGRGRLELSGPRPLLDVYLSAPRLQLDDFPVATQVVAPRVATLREMRATAGRTAARTQDLLSAAFLRRFDANLDIAVDEVLSGSDRLAAGMLRARLVDGRLDVSPAEIHIPGGSARLSLSYDSTGPQVALATGVHVDRFDYGILARRLRPGTDLAGLISLDLELAGKAPALSAIMAHADGRIDVAVWPKNLRGGVIDRWSVNVFFALLPFVDSNPQAQVNCAILRLDLRNGVLTHDLLLIDTGRVRVFGAGGADFATEEIGFRFRPRTKGLTFFSLQPPVDVTGTMTDFRVGLARGQAPQTITRFLSSSFVEPIRLLTRGRLPRDGADVCTDPMR